MKNAQRKKHHFTLVEILIGLITAAILLITATMILYQFHLAWQSNRKAVDLHRDGTVVMEFLNRKLREAARRSVTVTDQEIVIADDESHNQRFFVQDDDLLYDPDDTVGGDEFVLVKGALAEFATAKVRAGVSVRLLLNNGDETTDTACVIHQRN